ncbi:hypothetical protein CGH28_04955 [Vibrio parahaemolyticus]|nr:hypothetical protein CGJ99_08555 [Vibrio parahaemolyticus]TOO82061.1 hypothetical protein CGH28_04955 [Vibrio parahaemolyticus]
MARKKSKNLEAQRLCQQVLTAGFFVFWKGYMHLTQLADSKYHPTESLHVSSSKDTNPKKFKKALYLDLT